MSVGISWLPKNPVVDSPIIGATKLKHITDAVAALELTLTDDEIAALEGPYIPRELTFFKVGNPTKTLQTAPNGMCLTRPSSG